MVIIINNKVALAEIQEEKSERARKIGQIIQTSASLMKMTSEKNADDSAPLDYNKRSVELTQISHLLRQAPQGCLFRISVL